MAKNIKKEEENKDENKQTDLQYIKQSYALSSLYGDLSKLQVRLLIEMMALLSNRIAEMFIKRETNPTFLDDEKDSDGNIRISIPFRNITDRTKLYDDIERTAAHLISARIISKIDDGETKTSSYINAFTQIDVTKTATERRSAVTVKLSPYQAKILFDFSRYSSFLKVVAKEAMSVYTARIYMLITAWVYKGVWTVDYNELRNIFGLNQYDENTNSFCKSRYKLYKDFRKNVLVLAKKELEDLAEQQKTDCYFDFTEQWAEGVKPVTRNDPKSITFYIKRTAMGIIEEEKKRERKECISITDFMKEKLELGQKDCDNILSKINTGDAETMEKFSSIVHGVHDAIVKQLDHIKDKRKYALKCLQEKIKEMYDQTDATDTDTEQGKSEESVNEAATQEREKNIKKFAEFMHKNADKWAKAFKYIDMDEENIYIGTTKATHDTYVYTIGTSLFSKLQEEFCRNVKFRYSV